MLRASLVEGDEPCTASGEYIGAVSSYSEDDAAALAPNHPPLEPRLRYQDRGLIGRGGQGEVRRVYDSHIGRVLAMKILSFAKLGQPRAHARFWNEARITANLQHPAIVPVHDMGKLEDGRPFFTMAEVQGRTFTAHIRDLHDLTEPLEQRRALRRIVQSLARACEGLAYAHSRGVMHRDIKPHNLMVGRFGEVQVMDWG
ncbi:MAG: serine/threonine protein kinase, partial [Myxococcales bacterium]|nr:serine/threonine protein kinase [Myxococcales bacterium]